MLSDNRRNYSSKVKGKLHCSHLHGFRPGNKFHKKNEKEGGKRESFANNSQSTTPSFTQEQYKQILTLVNNANVQSTTNVAGLSDSLCFLCHENSKNYEKRIIDNGATDYIVSSSDLLHGVKSPSNSSIGLPNGKKTQITSIGLVKLSPDILKA